MITIQYFKNNTDENEIAEFVLHKTSMFVHKYRKTEKHDQRSCSTSSIEQKYILTIL